MLADVKSREAQKFLWDNEFRELKVIPSTTRKSPSKALQLFADILDFGRFRRVLDSGCGNGRNSIYLANKGCELHSIDFSSAALAEMRRSVQTLGLKERIQIHELSVLDPLPFQKEYFELVLDSYVFCHFFGHDRVEYKDSIHRVMKKGGYFILIAFPPEDGYYGPMLRRSDNGRAAVDPLNNIKKRLYTEEELENFFAPHFTVTYSATLRFTDIVKGRNFVRKVLSIVFTRG